MEPCRDDLGKYMSSMTAIKFNRFLIWYIGETDR